MDSGTFIALVVLTVLPVVGIWALITRFKNPFAEPTPFFQAVERQIDGYNSNAGDKPKQRPYMQSLVALAKEYGAYNEAAAYTIVAQWLKHYATMKTWEE